MTRDPSAVRRKSELTRPAACGTLAAVATKLHFFPSDFGTAPVMSQRLNEARWALARLTFITYIGFSVVSLVGGFLTAPLMTWYFFGDWRFWRHWSAGLGLLPHAWRLLKLMLRDNRVFMFSVPLTSPPRSTPDPATTTLQSSWPHGRSCGDCSNCCRPGGYVCPLLDQTLGLCRGHRSFYWRYFNCGRFPSVAPEIDYYDCRKWLLTPTDPITEFPVPVFPVAIRVAPNEASHLRVAHPTVEAQAHPTGEVPRGIGATCQEAAVVTTYSQ